MSDCCTNCFLNETARAFIRESGEFGDCDYCGSVDVEVIAAWRLKNLFRGVVSLYQPLEHGENFRNDADLQYWPGASLWTLINDDWKIFNDDLDLDFKVWDDLLDEIWLGACDPSEACLEALPSGDWVSNDQNFQTITPENTWNWFAHELKHGDLDAAVQAEEHEVILPDQWLPGVIEERDAVLVLPRGSAIFRGRLGFDEESSPRSGKVPLCSDKMGAPPAEKVITGGRANRAGTSVFYAALEAPTAVIESGRFPGATVSVRKAQLVRDLRLVDLTEIRQIDDPLGIDELADLLAHVRFLNRLNEELSRPVHPDESQVQYRPTQYLADLIRRLGFDGIAFKSSLNEGGTNFVFFDPSVADFTDEAHLVDIQTVKFTLSEPTSYQPEVIR